MDPVGTVAGIASLSLQLIDRWNHYRNYAECAASVRARYESQKVQLEEWRRESGLDDRRLPQYLRDNPEAGKKVLGVVKHILDNIGEQLESLGKKVDSYCAPPSRKSTLPLSDLNAEAQREPEADSSIDVSMHKSKKSIVKKVKTLKWCSGARARVIEVVDAIQAQIDTLYKLAPLKKPPDPKIEKLIQETQSIQELVAKHVLDQRDSIKSKHQQEIGDWLNTLRFDYSHKVFLRNRTPGTCKWLQNKSYFEEWDTSEGSGVLWISAPPGFGKSVLTATIVEFLEERNDRPVAYCFARSHKANSGELEDVPRLWLVQLIRWNEECLKLAVEYRKTSRYETASQDEVWALLTDICSEEPNCALILDGLDEYGHLSTSSLSPLLKSLKESGAKLLLSSRPEEDIKSSLKSAITNDSSCHFVELALMPEDTQSDRLKTMGEVASQMTSEKEASFRETLIKKAMEASNQSFLWISLLANSMHPGMTKTELLADVTDTPREIDDIYDKYWERILALPENQQERAFGMLSWISYARRPLTLEELAEAKCISTMSDDDDCEEYMCPDSLPQNIGDFEKYVNKLFGRLLEIRDTDGKKTIHPCHGSARDFFCKRLAETPQVQSAQRPKKADQYYEARIARNCIKYMKQEGAWHRNTDYWTSEMWQTPALTAYAVKYWPQHASMANMKDNDDFVGYVADFMQTDTTNFNKWARRFERELAHDYEEESSTGENFGSPLYYSCFLLPMQLVQLVYEADKSALNTTGGCYHTPIQAACARNEPKIVEKLCSWGADPGVKGGQYGTALNAAATKGFKPCIDALIKVLKRSKIPRDASDTDDGSDTSSIHSILNLPASVQLSSGVRRLWAPLHCAAYYGQTECAMSLLRAGAKVNQLDDVNATPLILAAEVGCVSMIKLLVENDADLEAATTKETDSLSALNAASRFGHLEAVKLLVEKGAKIDIVNEHNWRPLDYAAFRDRSLVVELLLRLGAPINADAGEGDKALFQCACSGAIDSAEILLAKGAKFYDTDPPGPNSPIHVAARRNQPELVQYMVDLGIPVDMSRIDNGWQPVHEAAFQGHPKVLQVLSDNGASMQATTSSGLTPMALAQREYETETIKWLLDHDVPFDCGEMTRLHFACLDAVNLEKLEALVNAGADVLATDKNGLRAFDLLCRDGQENLACIENLFHHMLQKHQGNFSGLSFVDHFDTHTSLPGLWKATYTYNRREDPEKPEYTDFEIEEMTPRQSDLCSSHQRCFAMRAKDMHDNFMMFGQASYGEGGFRFNKLYKINGWLFLGTINQTPVEVSADAAPEEDSMRPKEVTISGHWGLSENAWCGTFKLERTLNNTLTNGTT